MAAGTATDAQHWYLKQVDSQMGKVSNNHVFISLLLSIYMYMFKINKLYSIFEKILQFFGGGQPEDTEMTGKGEKIHRES